METNKDFIYARKRLLTAKESAEYLGIAIQTFYNMVAGRKIPFVTNPDSSGNRFWRCDIKDLHHWIENRKVGDGNA